MKIAIEAQRIFRKEKHGMDLVALEMIRKLQMLDKENEYYILVAPGDDTCLQSADNFHVVETGWGNYLLWEQVSLPLALRKIRPDLLHCTSNTAPLYCPYPLVLTLHDVIFMEKKMGNNTSLYQRLGRIYRRIVVPRIVKKARRVITVSQAEKQEILAHFSLEQERICVVHNGVGEQFRPIEEFMRTVRKYVPDSGYLFLLGNTDPKKNLPTVLKAYARYVHRSLSPRSLLLADLERAYLEVLLEKEGILNIRSLIHTPGYIAHQDLPAIYSGAFAFLYPSLRESFGLPVLEAMACGVPVITSRSSALPEVAGEDALLVDPGNEEEIARMMLKLETDPELYACQVSYGQERSREFSWTETAQKVRMIYLNKCS